MRAYSPRPSRRIVRHFPKYFVIYGGFNAMATSAYFWGAAVLTALCYKYFANPDWWGLVLNVVPGLVGFSIAGVAIFVSLGSDKLRASVAGKEPGSEELSPFIDFMAMFTHFIVVQLLALVVAVTSKALYESPIDQSSPLVLLVEPVRHPFWFVGGFLFMYATLLCVALALEIFRLAEMIDEFQTRENAKSQREHE
jgi:hypothetical protein